MCPSLCPSGSYVLLLHEEGVSVGECVSQQGLYLEAQSQEGTVLWNPGIHVMRVSVSRDLSTLV